MQEKYGALRSWCWNKRSYNYRHGVWGLRPIEIQYLDLCTLSNYEWRFGYPTIQNSRKTKAPLIIRTRGHLEGIWHWSPYGNDHQCHKRNSRFGSEIWQKQQDFIIHC
jgi:hypothetical protein